MAKKFLVTEAIAVMKELWQNYDDNITYDEKVRRDRLLAAHERINQEFKKWDCLSTTHFRHCTNMCANFVNAIAVIIQLEIEDSAAGS